MTHATEVHEDAGVSIQVKVKRCAWLNTCIHIYSTRHYVRSKGEERKRVTSKGCEKRVRKGEKRKRVTRKGCDVKSDEDGGDDRRWKYEKKDKRKIKKRQKRKAPSCRLLRLLPLP